MAGGEVFESSRSVKSTILSKVSRGPTDKKVAVRFIPLIILR